MNPIQNNSIPDSLTSFNGTPIDSSDMSALESEAAMAGISAGLNPANGANLVSVSPSPSTPDSYNIGVTAWNGSDMNIYNPNDSPDFYNIGITDETPYSNTAQMQIYNQRQQELNDFKRFMKGIRI